MTFRTLLVRALGLFFGLIFPAYGTITAIESPSGGDDTQWLVYWLIFSLLSITESVLWPVLKWLPLYQELKIALLAWLVLPQTQGAAWVYEAILQPGWAFARRELSKSPAFEKILARTASADFSGQAVSPEQRARQSEKRRSSLAEAVMSVSTKLESELTQISDITDHQQRARAERQFDKDISRLSKIGGRKSA